MNLCLFGGTFDPIHRGHLEAARRAVKKYKLNRVEFVVSDVPPHKYRQAITPYFHRYAMVALALAGEKMFFPSALEAPEPDGGPRFRYTIETLRRVKQSLRKSDRLFFLIGIDAFADISTWREPEALLRECEFIVVSRPGHHFRDIGRALPLPLQPSPSVLKSLERAKTGEELIEAGLSVHLLDGVRVPVSASAIRKAVAQGKSIERYVPRQVAEYIKKMKLYAGESSAVRLQSKLENS
ncbi:MAG: nicotinate-nucleotide adenylyltransferase [Acidobacteriales bacterium]|nr:nicotinate-nucleotide adenylyltransferase [Terriglobales bacterium]